MQTALIEILLGGELTNTVVKPVSVPEAIILKRLHGDDALRDGKYAGESALGNAEEIDRLKLTYGDRVFESAFPGALPSLPTTFAAAGIEVEGLPAAKAVASKSKEA